MLVMTLKEGERILIGDEIAIQLVRGVSARIGVEAPRDVKVDREVIRERIEREGRRKA